MAKSELTPDTIFTASRVHTDIPISEPSAIAYFGMVRANSARLSCIRCGNTRPLGLCANCGHDIYYFDLNDRSPYRDMLFTTEHAGYVRCEKCREWWNNWICNTCGTRNNRIRDCMSFEPHVRREVWRERRHVL